MLRLKFVRLTSPDKSVGEAKFYLRHVDKHGDEGTDSIYINSPHDRKALTVALTGLDLISGNLFEAQLTGTYLVTNGAPHTKTFTWGTEINLCTEDVNKISSRLMTRIEHVYKWIKSLPKSESFELEIDKPC